MYNNEVFKTTVVTVTSTTDLEGVGTVRAVGSKLYRWVQNGNASDAFANGDTVFHKPSDAANMLTKAYHKDDGTAMPLSTLAGIAVSAIAASSYGWIQIFGVHTEVKVINDLSGGTSIALGDKLVGVASQVYQTRSVASTAAPLHKNHLVALELYTKSTLTDSGQVVTTKKCFVSCL